VIGDDDVGLDLVGVDSDDLVFLQTRGGLVVLSPSRPDEFVTALQAELPTGPASWPTRSS
jgi:hypothetical protein